MNKQATIARNRIKTIVVSALGLAAVLGSVVMPLWSVLRESTKPLPPTVSRAKDYNRSQTAPSPHASGTP